MRLIASSNPDDVGRDQALHLLTQRAVLTRSVCRELLDLGGVFNGMRPLAALALLSRWVKDTFPETEPLGLTAIGWALRDGRARRLRGHAPRNPRRCGGM